MNLKTFQKKITLFPGGFQFVKNYGGYFGIDIWTGREFTNEFKNSDYFIGHSGGASFAVQYAVNQTSKFILVNPLVKKRNILSLFLRLLKYVFSEGIPKEKLVPMRYWPYALKKALKVVRVDFLSAIKQIPKENIVIIRGKRDYFFCDEEAAGIIRENGIRLIEVDAGHDWNETITEAVRGTINNELGTEIKQNTLQDVIDTKKDLFLQAPSKYGEFFDFALESFVLIENFIKSINLEAFIFAAFLSQIRKHHTLALLSSVRLHHIQTMMNLRQVLEAGSCAAFAIAHNSEEFTSRDKIRDKTYSWLKSNYPDESKEIKRIKELINSSTAHSNITYAHKNYFPNVKNKRFDTPFFDFEDVLHVKADLWLIGNIAMGLMDLLYKVNQNHNVLVFSDNFIEEIKKLQIKNNSLKKSLERHKV